MKTNKLVVVGAGHVGSQVVTACTHLELFSDITIIDKKKNVAAGESLDHRHALPALYRGNTNIQSGTYKDCIDADIIVIAVAMDESVPEGEEMPSRTAWGKENAKQVREVMDEITQYTKEAIIILITNPVDSITYIAENEYDYPKGKIFGTGTTLDSFRMRKIIADLYGIDSKAVSGFIIGEHGSTAFPVYSTISVSGMAIEPLKSVFPLLTFPGREELTHQVVHGANDVFNWKGWTNVAVAETAASIIRSIVLDEKMIYPVCATIDGLYGYNGEVAFSTPSIIGANGLEQQLLLPLTDEEKELLHLSASDIALAIQAIQ